MSPASSGACSNNRPASSHSHSRRLCQSRVGCSSSSLASNYSSSCKFFAVIWILALTISAVCCEKNNEYLVNQLCKQSFLRQLYRKADGATLLSQNERNLDCEITFQTLSILQKFMLRFDTLSLDCNDHLFVFDGGHAAGPPKMDISCRNTKQSVGVIITNTNHVTLKYVTDNWGTDSNGFKLVITAIKDPIHACRDFRCGNGLCIHPDLICDGINHCSDGSDESSSVARCQIPTENLVFGMDPTFFVLLSVCIILVSFAFLVGLAICLCRRAPVNNNSTMNGNNHPANGNGNFNSHSLYQTNIMVTNMKHSTLPREQTTRLSTEKMYAHENGGMNGNSHTIPRNFNLSLEATSIDGPSSVNLKSLMGQDLLPQTNNPQTKDEWFV